MKKLSQLGVLVDQKQLKTIDTAAKKMGLSRSAFVRHILLTYILEK